MSINIDEFRCPITMEIMTDPVILGDDGNTYERSAITNWLNSNHTSPITRVHADVRNLYPNRALKNLIETYRTGLHHTNSVTSVSVPINKKININSHMISPTELMVELEAVVEPTEPNMIPCDVIYCLDVSGSMNTEASVETSAKENDGLTRLDLVKYSTLAGISTMGPNDRVCIITFSDSAKRKCELTNMDNNGKQHVTQILNSLVTEGSTDIWRGLKECINVVNSINDLNRNIIVKLLTDGEPSTEPPQGIVQALQELITLSKLKQSFSINTIGFGYALKQSARTA